MLRFGERAPWQKCLLCYCDDLNLNTQNSIKAVWSTMSSFVQRWKKETENSLDAHESAILANITEKLWRDIVSNRVEGWKTMWGCILTSIHVIHELMHVPWYYYTEMDTCVCVCMRACTHVHTHTQKERVMPILSFLPISTSVLLTALII